MEGLEEKRTLVLEGMQAEAFTCLWNPQSSHVLAAGGDGSARLWEVPSDFSRYVESEKPRRFGHAGRTAEKKDVVTVAWSPNGEHLATGGYDGVIKVWAAEGELVHTLERHEGALFAIRWCQDGSSLVSGGADGVVVLWDLNEGEIKQEYRTHQDAVLDLCWRDETEFASCSKVRRKVAAVAQHVCSSPALTDPRRASCCLPAGQARGPVPRWVPRAPPRHVGARQGRQLRALQRRHVHAGQLQRRQDGVHMERRHGPITPHPEGEPHANGPSQPRCTRRGSAS